MVEYVINFIFFDRLHNHIPNGVIYQIRREVVRTLENAGYGRTLELAN